MIGYGLGVFGVEVRQKGRVRKVRQAGCIISHWVGWTRDVIMPENIAVIALVDTKKA